MTTLDVSNHDLSTFDAPCLAANGVGRIIVGCWDAAATREIIRRARAAGIVCEDLYAYLYYGTSWEQREVINALNLAAELGGIRRVWLDCEADAANEAAGQTPASRRTATWGAVARVRGAGLAPGIYTYEWYWRAQMENTSAFAALPLWYANYGTNDPSAPRPPIHRVSFGGWDEIAAHQYSSTIPVCGRGRDHNYWYLEEAEMPDPRVDALITDIAELRHVLTGYEDRIAQAIVLNDWRYERTLTPEGAPYEWDKAHPAGRSLIGFAANLNTALLRTIAQVRELAMVANHDALIDWAAIRRELQDVVDTLPAAANVEEG